MYKSLSVRKGIRVRDTRNSAVGVVVSEVTRWPTGIPMVLVDMLGELVSIPQEYCEYENRTEELLNILPEDFLAALRVDGTSKEYNLDVMLETEVPLFEDDGTPYTLSGINHGFQVIDGILYCLLYITEDGERTIDERKAVNDEDFDEWSKFDPDEYIEAWKTYYQWVIDNGKDPLNTISTEDRKSVPFKVSVIRYPNGVQFVDVTNLETHTLYKALDIETVPEAVRLQPHGL